MRRCKAHSVNYVVEAALEQRKQILTGDALGTVSLYEVALKLLLLNAVVSLSSLLLAKLHAVFSLFLSCGTVLTGSGRTAVKCALTCGAALTLKKELLTLPAAESASRSCISCHFIILLQITTVDQTRLLLGGLQPLCGIGVTSLIRLMSRPAV